MTEAEKAARDWAKAHSPLEWNYGHVKGFLAGAAWQREQDAKLAEKERKSWTRPGGQDSFSMARRNGAAEAARSIRDAILARSSDGIQVSPSGEGTAAESIPSARVGALDSAGRCETYSASAPCSQCGSKNTYLSKDGYNSATVCRDCRAERHTPQTRTVCRKDECSEDSHRDGWCRRHLPDPKDGRQPHRLWIPKKDVCRFIPDWGSQFDIHASFGKPEKPELWFEFVEVSKDDDDAPGLLGFDLAEGPDITVYQCLRCHMPFKDKNYARVHDCRKPQQGRKDSEGK
jgi:hypothetical protein